MQALQVAGYGTIEIVVETIYRNTHFFSDIVIIIMIGLYIIGSSYNQYMSFAGFSGHRGHADESNAGKYLHQLMGHYFHELNHIL
jgi:hypothetical protein